MRFAIGLYAMLFAFSVFGQSIVTPVFPHKDGEASASAYTGSQKDLLVDGGAAQTVGWASFQMTGIDTSKITAAKLALYVSSLASPGTVEAYALTSDISAPENNVPLSALHMGSTPLATAALGTGDVENVLLLDITSAVKSGNFHGVCLASSDGMKATFDSKEGHLQPMVMLTYDIGAAAGAWLTGNSAPTGAQGKDGDLFLNTSSGDVFQKSAGVWNVSSNIMGPQGPKGDPGIAGPAGAAGPQGVAGP